MYQPPDRYARLTPPLLMCSLLKQGLCVLLCVLLCVFYVFSSEAGLNGSTYVFSTPPLTNVFSFVFSSEAGLNVSATQQLHRIIVENEINDLDHD